MRDASFLSEYRLYDPMYLSVFKCCCNTENRFSHGIFVPHGLQNKIVRSVENICSPNTEINDRIRVDNGVFSYGISKTKIINKKIFNTIIQTLQKQRSSINAFSFRTFRRTINVVHCFYIFFSLFNRLRCETHSKIYAIVVI